MASAWVSSVFNAVGKSEYWKDSAIILTYDDWGGWYDHVEPTTFDYFEPGFRIPLVIVSPYARRGAVYDTWARHFGEKGDPRILVVSLVVASDNAYQLAIQTGTLPLGVAALHARVLRSEACT